MRQTNRKIIMKWKKTIARVRVYTLCVCECAMVMHEVYFPSFHFHFFLLRSNAKW